MTVDNIITDRFDFESAMLPIWEGDLVCNETIMPLDIGEKIKLLYNVTELVSVRSVDLKTEYEAGVDYNFDGESIELLPGTRVNFIGYEKYYSHNEAAPFHIMVKGGQPGDPDRDVFYSEEIWQYQLCVTYKCRKPADRFIPGTQAAQFERLIGKLRDGKDVTMMFYGDSITFGASATYISGRSPYTPTWSMLVTKALARRFGYKINYVPANLPGTPPVPSEPEIYGSRGTITYINPAVGGWTVVNGIEKYDLHVRPFIDKYGCDFFLLAFGMNDAGNSPERECELQKNITDSVLAQAPDCELMLVSTMVPNPEAVNGWFGNQHIFEPEMMKLAADYNAAGVHCALAPMTSMSKYLLTRKHFRDYTGNNVNHPNDFMTRVYAHTVLKTVID